MYRTYRRAGTVGFAFYILILLCGQMKNVWNEELVEVSTDIYDVLLLTKLI